MDNITKLNMVIYVAPIVLALKYVIMALILAMHEKSKIIFNKHFVMTICLVTFEGFLIFTIADEIPKHATAGLSGVLVTGLCFSAGFLKTESLYKNIITSISGFIVFSLFALGISFFGNI